MKSMLNALALGLSLTLALPVWADMHHASNGAADHAAMLTEGLVKKIDKAQGKLTLKHGPLANLEMPGMTMVFRVEDATWRACPEFCVNGPLAGNCRLVRRHNEHQETRRT